MSSQCSRRFVQKWHRHIKYQTKSVDFLVGSTAAVVVVVVGENFATYESVHGPVNLSQEKNNKKKNLLNSCSPFPLFLLPLCPVCSNYPVDGSGGGLPAKVKKSRSNGSLKKAEARKSLSLEAAQLEIQQQQHKTLSRHVVVG